ncbi:hypothetical protein [Corynebacterium uterequi]|uniref:Uncharacterized protein n=1 Tax=Corynebacterium uterequi TaxID=1072256 RepID=A0A0G3H9L5_9CORY|nr:hypothetical protein [Corynebacterium uterequi]AKK10061.1 hypothetical protein CUTER_00155 [Corynebacterium uterequi]
MNPLLIKQGLSLANQLRSTLKDNKSKRERGDYDNLLGSAERISELRSHLEDLARREADRLGDKEADRRRRLREGVGPVTHAAHVRLQRAKDRLAEERESADIFDFAKAKQRLAVASDEAEKGVAKGLKKLSPLAAVAAKRSRKVAAAAEKTTQKATKKAAAKARKAQRKRQGGSTGRRLGIVGAILAVLAAIAGAVVFVVQRNRRDEPATTPPRVEEQESRLVYTSTTEQPIGDLAEEPAERDEELLESLDEQLQAHREEESQAENKEA